MCIYIILFSHYLQSSFVRSRNAGFFCVKGRRGHFLEALYVMTSQFSETYRDTSCLGWLICLPDIKNSKQPQVKSYSFWIFMNNISILYRSIKHHQEKNMQTAIVNFSSRKCYFPACHADVLFVIFSPEWIPSCCL